MTPTSDKLHTAANIPTGRNLLAILVDLLADQEGVSITYELESAQ